MIYQALSLAPHLSVMENILMGAEPMRFGLVDRSKMRAMATRALADLGHDDISPDAPVGSLSVAAQQLVEIARAIAVGCRVLVLDEPTSSLGRADVERLFDLLARLKAQGHAIVYISHFIEEVKEVADRFTVLRDGRNAGGGSTAGATHDDIVSLMVGGDVGDLFPRSDTRRAAKPSWKSPASQPGSASFSLHRGEILGIAGLIGSGRTRLLRTLFGLSPVRSGRVRMAMFTGTATPKERWQQGMGLLSEDRTEEGLALGLDIAEQSDDDPAVVLRSGRPSLAGTPACRRVSLDPAAADQMRRDRTSPRASSPAATSRRSRSPGCCTTMSTCFCSTSRRAASTSAARRRSTG